MIGDGSLGGTASHDGDLGISGAASQGWRLEICGGSGLIMTPYT